MDCFGHRSSTTSTAAFGFSTWWSESGLPIRDCYELISGFSDAWLIPEAQLQEKGHVVQGQWRILYHSNSPLIPLSQPT